jgi:hypothetical protein
MLENELGSAGTKEKLAGFEKFQNGANPWFDFLSFRIAGRLDLAIFTGFQPTSASVAQLGEQRFCKPQVVGSSPSAGSFGVLICVEK